MAIMNGSETPRVLLVEDEEHLAAGMKLNFELEGYDVDLAHTAREAAAQMVQAAGNGHYDVIVLDVMLPDSTGFELCKRLRDGGIFTPILMLTALGATEDRVKGLQVGADDYLVKPFELDELLARVRSLLRRRSWEREEKQVSGPSTEIGGCEVDFASRVVRKGGEEQHLTSLEFDLLEHFVQNPNRVLTRQELQAEVWKLENYPDTRSVDNKVSKLRKVFEAVPSRPRLFVSVRGRGYKFVPGR